MKTSRAVLPAALASLALLLGGCGALGGDDQSPTASETKKTKKPQGGGSDSSEPEPSESASSEPSGETTTVPAYWVGETPQGPRLYREFQPVSGDPATGAAALLTDGKGLDADYRSLLDGVSFSSVEASADAITVTLGDDAWAERPSGMSAADAGLAVQQLVYTLQGVAQARVPVEVLTTGGETGSLLGVATPVKNKDALQVLALVNVTEPAEGQTVSGVFTASGVASSFEANVPWQVRDPQTGEVVMDGFATADGWMDKLYPWQVDVDVSSLPAGVYEFVARTDDPSDGEGGGPTEDTKNFVVE